MATLYCPQGDHAQCAHMRLGGVSKLGQDLLQADPSGWEAGRDLISPVVFVAQESSRRPLRCRGCCVLLLHGHSQGSGLVLSEESIVLEVLLVTLPSRKKGAAGGRPSQWHRATQMVTGFHRRVSDNRLVHRRQPPAQSILSQGQTEGVM